MISEMQLYSLIKIYDKFNREVCGNNQFVDLTLKIKEKVNLKEFMQEIEEVCDENKYFVGFHIGCTRLNILPAYKKTERLILNRDHFKGLIKIIQVSRGLIKDF